MRTRAAAELRARYRAEGWWDGRTVRDVIEAAVGHWPERRMVFHSPVCPSETTFAGLWARARRLAGALWELGLRPGDVLVVRMPNWEEAVVAYQAGAVLGCVLVPLIHVYQEAETGFVLRQSGAAAAVVPAHDAEMVERVRPKTLRHVIAAPEGVRELEARGLQPPWVELDPDAPHVLAYTSGTTAEPKGVLHSHHTLLAECRSLARTTRQGEEDVFFTPFPVGHIAGMMTVLVNPFLYGHTTVVMDGWDPGAALELMEAERVTRSGGAPFFLHTLLDHPDLHRRDLSSMRTYGLGGAGVPPSLVERAEREAGWVAFRAYGCTEHPSATGGTEDDPLEKRAWTDGRPMPGVELRIRGGEIQTRGPELFLGYTDPALEREAFTEDGWFRTGDVGYLDAEGYLVVTDRLKDIIIRGGENVSAREVEEVLLRMPSVADAAVTPVSDPLYGERVCAFVVPRGEPPTLEAVREHFAASGVARQKWPERLEVVGALPRTLAGKVQKYLLRRAVEGGGVAGGR